MDGYSSEYKVQLYNPQVIGSNPASEILFFGHVKINKNTTSALKGQYHHDQSRLSTEHEIGVPV